MGKVAMKYRLMPESTDFDFEALVGTIPSRLPAGSEMKDSRVVPVAFGLKSCEVMIVATDQEGVADAVEGVLSSLDGIQSVESLETTLL